MSNFISSDEKGTKNWFIYRFLDEKKKCCAIEWNIHHKVLEQYGTVLRGSLLLTFSGTKSDKGPITMLLRPRLGFDPDDALAFVPESEDLENDSPVMLSIDPVPPGDDPARP
jgi:hypothetical protein